MREIKYNFLHWGPFVTHYKLLPEELQAFNKLEEGEDFKKGLAGHLKDEYELDKNRVFSIILPYLNSYVKGFWDHRNIKLPNGFELKNAWINRQKKNEFNPPHTHDDDLSFVIYTKIPEDLEQECRSSVANSPGPGCIVFDFNMPSSAGGNKMFLQTHAHLPSVGDMFIFPAGLPHWVYPFKTTEGERVSISGNVKFYGGKKSKYKSVVIKKKRYYFYKITWVDPTGDSGHANAHDSLGLTPSKMVTHAYLFHRDKKNIWTFGSYEDGDELFSDRNVFPIGCIAKMERILL